MQIQVKSTLKLELKIVGALLRNQGLLIVKEKLSSENMNDCASTLLILQAIINTQQTPSAIVEWFVELKEQIMVSGNNIINGIVTEIEDLLRGNGNQKEKVTSICIG